MGRWRSTIGVPVFLLVSCTSDQIIYILRAILSTLYILPSSLIDYNVMGFQYFFSFSCFASRLAFRQATLLLELEGTACH